MSNTGIGTPYWYEWEIGLIECVKMLSNSSIESVTLQSSDFQSLDDVVVKFNDGSIINIQVKHTDDDNNMTYSFLESKEALQNWAKEWKNEKENYVIKEIRIVSNKKWGKNKSNGKCSFSTFVSNVLPQLKKQYSFISTDASENKAIKWFKNKIDIIGDDASEFTKILSFEQAPNLVGLEEELKELLKVILGADKNKAVDIALEKLRAELQTWSTSRRKKQEIFREDVYRVLCSPSQTIPQYELYPEKPILPSRVKYAYKFISLVENSEKNLIFLQGAPGAGKTNFVSYLAQLKNTIVDFRYYTYLPVNRELPVYSDDEGFYNGKTLWCSILQQLKVNLEKLNLLSELKFPLIYDYLTVTELRECVLKFLPTYAQILEKNCYIFIDGLDHAARSDDARNSFLSQIPTTQEIGDKVKFILIGQPVNDKYPNWLVNNQTIEYCELPSLEERDIVSLLKSENVDIQDIDINTFTNSIMNVVGRNILNVLFAIYEVKKLHKSNSFDEIIEQLEKRCLNGHINRYYDWIISSIEQSLDLYKLETIFAYSSRKISVSDLAVMCGKDTIEIEYILNKLYPLVIADDFGYAPFHNDVRLYFKESIRTNSNYNSISKFIFSSIQNNKNLEVYKYDILFDLICDTNDIQLLFEFYTPEYIIHSVKYQISIDNLINYFTKVVRLIKEKKNIDYVHNLSLVATTISKFIECVRYYEKESSYLENQMPHSLTHSEKYVLEYPDCIEDIIDDIYALLEKNEFERAKKLFKEYLLNISLSDIMNCEIKNGLHEDNNFYNKCGYIYRCFMPERISQLNDNDKYYEFVTGWLKASFCYITTEEIIKTFAFRYYNIIDLFNYFQFISQSECLGDDEVACISEILTNSKEDSIYIDAEWCSYLLIKNKYAEEFKERLNAKVLSLSGLKDLNYQNTALVCFFKVYFCLYDYNKEITWNKVYTDILKGHHIEQTTRGYVPAMALKDLAQKIYNLFYFQGTSDEDVLSISVELAYFTRHYGTGSSNDCSSFEIIPFLKKVFVNFLINNSEQVNISKLCEDMLDIFTKDNPTYIKEFVCLYFYSNNKKLFLEIAEFWVGENGYIWKNEYDNMEFVCNSIISILGEFEEYEMIKDINIRKMFRLFGYVGHKDYTINGLLDCFNKIPSSENKLTKYGMELLTISDLASDMGDNRSSTSVDEALFELAILLGANYSDALFELKNKPEYLVYWRNCLLKAYYSHLNDLSFNDDQLCALYMLTNAWINVKIENSISIGKGLQETLNHYNHQIIELIQDQTLKEKLISLGNCYINSAQYDCSKYHVGIEEEYSGIISSFEKSGYTDEFEKALSLEVSNKGHNHLGLLLYLGERISPDKIKEFTLKCVLPYIYQNNEYSYRAYGHNMLIETYCRYFNQDTWISLYNDLSERIQLMEDKMYEFYSISDDFEILSLHYFNSNYQDKIEQIYEDRVQMHLLFTSACNTVSIDGYNIVLDSAVDSFLKFVEKQIDYID